MSRRTVAVVAAAALVVLAGCGAPLGGSEAEATPTASGGGDAGTNESGNEIAVRNGSLPVDPDRAFRRTQAVLGSDVEPPAAVVVADDPENGTAEPPPFWSAMGVERAPSEPVPTAESGYTTPLGAIVLSPGESANASRVEWLLIHEFVHYVQFREERATALRSRLPATTDGAFVTRAVTEGVAVSAADAAERREGGWRGSDRYSALRDAHPAGSYQRYVLAQYVAGHAYVADRFEDPAAASAVYERPPTTGEQVLHGVAPGEEPPRELRVAVRTDGNGFSPAGRDTMGEPFVRTALANGVDESQAASAAAGWGNDSRVVFRDGDAVGYAWTLRWDDAENASGFRPVAVQYLAGQESVDAFRVESVGEETVVLLLGDRSFVRAASVGGTSGNVTVGIGA